MIADIYNAPKEIVEAIKVCLLSERSGSDSERLDGRGWWGDALSDVILGSDLWRLERSILSQENLKKAENYAYYALKWLVEKKFLKSIQIKSFGENSTLKLEIRCVQI